MGILAAANTIGDLRRFPRRPAYIVARYRVGGAAYRDIIRNIGAGGVFVWSRRRIDNGQSIRLEFPLFAFDRPVKLAGTVVRSGSRGFAVVFRPPIRALAEDADRLREVVHESQRWASGRRGAGP